MGGCEALVSKPRGPATRFAYTRRAVAADMLIAVRRKEKQGKGGRGRAPPLSPAANSDLDDNDNDGTLSSGVPCPAQKHRSLL